MKIVDHINFFKIEFIKKKVNFWEKKPICFVHMESSSVSFYHFFDIKIVKF